MKHLLPFFFLPFLFLTASSQNLVPNPSFEEYSDCPDNPGQIDRASFWYSPTTGSSDYFNSCFTTGGFNMGVPLNLLGYQNPLSGEAYAGLILFENAGALVYREYLQVKLLQTLTQDQVYYFSINVSLADSSIYTMRDFSAHFSSDSVLSNNFQNLSVTPQISYDEIEYFNETDWMNITGEYIALGTENFMTLGFFDDNTFIDTVLTGNSTDIINYEVCYVYIDDVCLSDVYDDCDKSNGINNPEIKKVSVFPNPAKDFFCFHMSANSVVNVELFNTVSIEPITLPVEGKNGYSICQLPFLNEGIYNVRITTQDQIFYSNLLILQ